VESKPTTALTGRSPSRLMRPEGLGAAVRKKPEGRENPPSLPRESGYPGGVVASPLWKPRFPRE